MKLCRSCNVEKPLGEFHSCERQRVQSRCKTCKSEWARNYYASRPDVRAQRKWARYGITDEERLALRSNQGGCCAVCQCDLEGGMREHIDHCHETGVVRGILCSECNTGIGKMHDDPARLRQAADYLERNRDVAAWWSGKK